MKINTVTDAQTCVKADHSSDVPASRLNLQPALSAAWDGLRWVWAHVKVPDMGRVLHDLVITSTEKPPSIDQQAKSASAHLCLEETLASLTFQRPVDVNTPVDFIAFLNPNEFNVYKVKEHLDQQEKIGPMVVTGTERSFFDLCLCNPDKCTGLIVRDINPKVKAYVDFNTLLLRIADNVGEYAQMSDDLMSLNDLKQWVEGSQLLGEEKKFFLENPTKIQQLLYENPDFIRRNHKALLTRTEYLQCRIESSNIPQHLKQYYFHHLNDFAEIYFNTTKSWRSRDKQFFEGVQYHENPNLFNKLQQFARSGNIIATIGDINDLRFLENLNVGILDVSNIPDYVLLDLKADKSFSPHIIWTYLHSGGDNTTYYSCPCLSLLQEQERGEFDQLLQELRQAKCIEKELFTIGGAPKLGIDLFHTLLHLRKSRPDIRPVSYSAEILKQLKEFKEQWMLEIPGNRWISFDSSNFDTNQINSLSVDEINAACKNPKIVRFLPQLIENWLLIDYDKYVAFSKIPGWREAFLTEAEKASTDSCMQWRREAFQKNLASLYKHSAL